MYKFQDLEQQLLKTKSNISSKLLERHQQCSTSDNITERLLSIRSPRLYFEHLKENRGGGEVGVCHPVLHFPYPFSDQTSKIHSHFQIWPLGRNYFINTWNRAQTKKNSSNAFWIYILFCSYSFGIETINTFIHSCSSLENHTRFKTKWAQCMIPIFRPKRPKNHTLWGSTYLYCLHKGVPPTGGRGVFTVLLLNKK